MRKYNREKQVHLFAIAGILVFCNVLVVVTSASSKKCATLYTGQGFSGTPYSLADGVKQPSLRHMNFVPNSVQVSDNCFLTVFDVYGGKQTLQNDTSYLGWHSNKILDAACCECDGCRGAAYNLGNFCARLFEHPRCDSCSGFRLDFKNGDAAKNLGILDKKMSSTAVRHGCSLTVFYEAEFQGWRYRFNESSNMLGENWHKQISSAVCNCNSNSEPITHPTAPTRYPITLPTVPTRPPMTLPTWPPVTHPTVPTRPPYTLPTWPPVTHPTVETRPPMTLPTVPTRPPMTLPTVPTRPPMTLPTVPTRPPMTLPTVPTRPPMTLPTVPTRPPITLPTVPTRPPTIETTTEDQDSFFGGQSFEDSPEEEESEEDDLFNLPEEDPKEEYTTTEKVPEKKEDYPVEENNEENEDDDDDNDDDGDWW